MSAVAAIQPPHVAPPSCDLSTQKEKNLKVGLIGNRELLGGTREAEGEKAVLRVGAANAAFKETGEHGQQRE